MQHIGKIVHLIKWGHWTKMIKVNKGQCPKKEILIILINKWKKFKCNTDLATKNKVIFIHNDLTKHGKPNIGCSTEGRKNWYNLSVGQFGNQNLCILEFYLS